MTDSLPGRTPTILRQAQIANPEVSILMSVYNTERYLEATLRSILAQEGLTFEVVVLDAASTDASPRIVQQLADARVTSLRAAEKVFISTARNLAAVRARAPWLCFFDADDLMLPGTLAEYVRTVARQPETKWAYCGLETVDAEGRRLNQQMRTPFDLLKMLQRNIVPQPMAMLRRELFQQVGGYDEQLPYGEDYDLWLRALERATPFFYDRICVQYRRHANNITNTNKDHGFVFERFRARLQQPAPTPAIENRREILRRGLAFLAAGAAGRWSETIALGDDLTREGIGGFELHQQMARAWRAVGEWRRAYALALSWVQKMAGGETILPYEQIWAVATSLEIALQNRDLQVTRALLPLAEFLYRAFRSPELEPALAQARAAAGG